MLTLIADFSGCAADKLSARDALAAALSGACVTVGLSVEDLVREDTPTLDTYTVTVGAGLTLALYADHADVAATLQTSGIEPAAARDLAQQIAIYLDASIVTIDEDRSA